MHRIQARDNRIPALRTPSRGREFAYQGPGPDTKQASLIWRAPEAFMLQPGLGPQSQMCVLRVASLCVSLSIWIPGPRTSVQVLSQCAGSGHAWCEKAADLDPTKPPNTASACGSSSALQRGHDSQVRTRRAVGVQTMLVGRLGYPGIVGSAMPVHCHLPPCSPATYRAPPGLSLVGDGQFPSAPSPFSGVGSEGHPELCKRPCVLMAKGFCHKGTACEFCHERHETQAKLDKQQRWTLRNMSALDRYELLLPYICRRLADAGLMARAGPLLLLLETDRAEHICRADNEQEASED